jgi:hypothetical protein
VHMPACTSSVDEGRPEMRSNYFPFWIYVIFKLFFGGIFYLLVNDGWLRNFEVKCKNHTPFDPYHLS